MKAPERTGPVLLFDGECGLCHRVVRLLLRLDHGARLRFAPLQGPAAQAFLQAHGLPAADFDSLVFVPDWAGRDPSTRSGQAHSTDSTGSRQAGSGQGGPGFLLRTDGAMAALRVCGGAERVLAGGLGIFPVAWRDAGYRFVARWRHRMFGVWKPRPVARAEWAARFLE